jgi:hypothetical protein
MQDVPEGERDEHHGRGHQKNPWRKPGAGETSKHVRGSEKVRLTVAQK